MKRLHVVLLLASGLVAACGGDGMQRLRTELRAGRATPAAVTPDTSGDRPPSQVAFALRYRIELVGQHDGAYVPIERASVALDPLHARIYAATSRGTFFAYAADGTRRFRRSFGSPIDAAPVLDSTRDVVYVAGSDGKVHALSGASGEPTWTAEIGQPLTSTPVLTEDTLYVVSDTDVVSALDRADGTVLWSYRRPQNEEISITGHAGLTLSGTTLLAAFNDGTVAGLGATDGSVLWEIDTSVDLPPTANGLPRMRDIDTTPVVVGERLFVASFAAGLYELNANNGTVVNRDETWTGITALLALPGGDLFLASADRGYARLDPTAHRLLWTRPLDRGAPTGAVYVPERDAIIYGESRGALLAVTAADGFEVARFESGYGFGAQPVAVESVVGVLSNTGSLYVLEARPNGEEQP